MLTRCAIAKLATDHILYFTAGIETRDLKIENYTFLATYNTLLSTLQPLST